jgi:hypothetical protein
VKLLSFEAAKAISQVDSRGATIGGIAKCSGDIRLSVLELEAAGRGIWSSKSRIVITSPPNGRIIYSVRR